MNIPDIYVIDHLDKIRSLYGDETSVNNLLAESKAQALKYVIFDSTGLTIKDLKEIYKDQFVTVNIVTSNNKKLTYSYNIGDMIKEAEE